MSGPALVLALLLLAGAYAPLTVAAPAPPASNEVNDNQCSLTCATGASPPRSLLCCVCCVCVVCVVFACSAAGVVGECQGGAAHRLGGRGAAHGGGHQRGAWADHAHGGWHACLAVWVWGWWAVAVLYSLGSVRVLLPRACSAQVSGPTNVCQWQDDGAIHSVGAWEAELLTFDAMKAWARTCAAACSVRAYVRACVRDAEEGPLRDGAMVSGTRACVAGTCQVHQGLIKAWASLYRPRALFKQRRTHRQLGRSGQTRPEQGWREVVQTARRTGSEAVLRVHTPLARCALRTYLEHGRRVETISWQPRAFVFHNLLTTAECDHLVDIGSQRVRDRSS